MTNSNRLKGLGGWLILVGIGVIVSPIRLLSTLIPTYKPIFENGAWEALTTPGSASYIPYFGGLLIGEIACNTAIFVACVYLIYLFFSKHYLFPRVYIGVAVASLIFIPLDAWIVTKVMPEEEMFDSNTIKEFMRSLVVGVIWVPYMLLSERVNVTFVEHMPNSRLQYAPPEPN